MLPGLAAEPVAAPRRRSSAPSEDAGSFVDVEIEIETARRRSGDLDPDHLGSHQTVPEPFPRGRRLGAAGRRSPSARLPGDRPILVRARERSSRGCRPRRLLAQPRGRAVVVPRESHQHLAYRRHGASPALCRPRAVLLGHQHLVPLRAARGVLPEAPRGPGARDRAD